MLQAIIITFVIASLPLSCQLSDHTKSPEKRSLKITLEIVPEGDSLYSVSWKDTIGQKGGYNLINRPNEVWCFIKDESDTVGYYHGLSTPRNFTYFSTTDTIVTATFMISPNIFSEHYQESSNKILDTVVRFHPIKLNLKKDLRKSLEIILERM